MNTFDVYTAPVLGGGYHAMVRTASDGEPKPVMGRGGRPIVFEEELHAWQSAIRHLLRYINGHLTRDGEVAGAILSEAEAHFASVLRQKGKTRVISVSYKGARRRK